MASLICDTAVLLDAFLDEMISAWFIALHHVFLNYCSRMNREINLRTHYDNLDLEFPLRWKNVQSLCTIAMVTVRAGTEVRCFS